MGKKIKDIIKKIEAYEYYQNGFNHLSASWVKAKNIRFNSYIIIADVYLCSGEGEETEQYLNCEYTNEILKNY